MMEAVEIQKDSGSGWQFLAVDTRPDYTHIAPDTRRGVFHAHADQVRNRGNHHPSPRRNCSGNPEKVICRSMNISSSA